MIPDLVESVLRSVNSLFSFLPGFLRPYGIIGAVLGIIYFLGFFGEDTEDPVDRIVQGINVGSDLLTIIFNFLGHGLIFALKIGFSCVTRLVRGLWQRSDDLIEVEEAPIKIGPVIEIYGFRIGLLWLLALALGVITWGLGKTPF